jgi:hypothetical protein
VPADRECNQIEQLLAESSSIVVAQLTGTKHAGQLDAMNSMNKHLDALCLSGDKSQAWALRCVLQPPMKEPAAPAPSQQPTPSVKITACVNLTP